MSEWEIVQRMVPDPIMQSRVIIVENIETGERRKVLINSWEDVEDAVGEKIADGDFYDDD